MSKTVTEFEWGDDLDTALFHVLLNAYKNGIEVLEWLVVGNRRLQAYLAVVGLRTFINVLAADDSYKKSDLKRLEALFTEPEGTRRLSKALRQSKAADHAKVVGEWRRTMATCEASIAQ